MQPNGLTEEAPAPTPAEGAAMESDGVQETAAKMATRGSETGGTDTSTDPQAQPSDPSVSDTNVPAVEENGQCEAIEANGVTGEEDEEEAAGQDPDDRCEDDPNFGAVCSFFLKFGLALGISYSIDDLKIMLEDHDHGKLVVVSMPRVLF